MPYCTVGMILPDVITPRLREVSYLHAYERVGLFGESTDARTYTQTYAMSLAQGLCVLIHTYVPGVGSQPRAHTVKVITVHCCSVGRLQPTLNH